jgi:hypothetical protein
VGGRLVRELELGTLLFSFVIIIHRFYPKGFPITVFLQEKRREEKHE